LKPDSREHGEAQVLAELICTMLVNYARATKVVPIVNMFTNGPYVKFVSIQASKEYIAAIANGSLKGIKVDDRPHFAVYPAYDPEKTTTAQGFNLLDASDRAHAITTLVQLRHNLICSCP